MFYIRSGRRNTQKIYGRFNIIVCNKGMEEFIHFNGICRKYFRRFETYRKLISIKKSIGMFHKIISQNELKCRLTNSDEFLKNLRYATFTDEESDQFDCLVETDTSLALLTPFVFRFNI